MSEQNSPKTIGDYLNTSQAEFLEENKDQLGSATLAVIEAQREGGAEYNPLRDEQVFNAGQSSEFFGNIPSSIDLDITEDYNIDSWNESLNVIKDKITKARSDNGLAYTDDDIANRYKGDAYTEDENEFVSPWKNINNNDYSQVRGEDFLASANNNSNMQFTINNTSELKAYLRLIMPMYKRSVEVEDLNRNFWVIGNVLTYLCDFLFEDKSPYANVLNSLLSEISQLWDNILYLWQALQETEKEIVTDVQTIILPINGIEDEDYDNIKFDNFNNVRISENDLKIIAKYFYTKDDQGIDPSIKNLCDSVEKQILKIINSYSINSCILPVFRINNYKHNYYSGEYMIGIFVHNVNLDEPWFFYPFEKHEVEFDSSNPNNYFIVGMDLSKDQEIDFKCLKEEETQYKVMDSFNGSIYSEERGYYALVRLETNFYAYYSSNNDYYPYIIPDSSWFLFCDIVPKLCGSDQIPKKGFQIQGIDCSTGNQPRIVVVEVVSDSEQENQEEEENQEVEENDDDDDFIKVVDIEKGFYQGELLSYMKPSAEYNVGINSIEVLPVNCPYDVLQDIFYNDSAHKLQNSYNYNDNYAFSENTGEDYEEDYSLDPIADSFLSYFKSYDTNNNDPNIINIDTINQYLIYNPLEDKKNDEFIIHEATNKGGCHNQSMPNYEYSNNENDGIKLKSSISSFGKYNFTIKLNNDEIKIYQFKVYGSRSIPSLESNNVDSKRALEWKMDLYDETDSTNNNPIRSIFFKIGKQTQDDTEVNANFMHLALQLSNVSLEAYGDPENDDSHILLKYNNNSPEINLKTESGTHPHFYNNNNSNLENVEKELIRIEKHINFIEINNYIDNNESNNEQIISQEFMNIVKIFLIPPYTVGDGKVHSYDSASFLIPRKIDCNMEPGKSSYTAILYPPKVLMDKYSMEKININNYNRSYSASEFTYGGVNKFYSWNEGNHDDSNNNDENPGKIPIKDINYFDSSGFYYNDGSSTKYCSCSVRSELLNNAHPSKTLVLIKKTDSHVKKNNWILIHIETTILTRVRQKWDNNNPFIKYLLCNKDKKIYVEDEDEDKDTFNDFGIIISGIEENQIQYQREKDKLPQDYYCANYYNRDSNKQYQIRYTGDQTKQEFKQEIVGFHLGGYNINVFQMNDDNTFNYYNRHVDRVWEDKDAPDELKELKWKNSFIGVTGNDEDAQLDAWEEVFTNIMNDYKVLNEEIGIPEYFYKNKDSDEEYYEYFCEQWGIKK